MISFFRLLTGIVHLLLLPFLSALVLCVILYASGLADRLPILVWLAAAPLLYFLWLVIFLTFSAIQIQIVSRLFPKPRRTSSAGDRFSFAGLFLMYYYQRAFQVWNLPLTSCLLRVPYMRELLLLSYAPHIHVGRNSLLLGYVYDPDLAEIGDGAVIGGRSAIVAHMLTSKPDGEYVYACAPIKIGSHAVIGGEARIAMGVTIGDDAVVEPCSNVLPFTNIPPGEVWGGNPAAFLRKRIDVVLSSSNQQNVYKTDAGVDSANCKIDTDEIIRRLVAEALNLPLDKVHSNLSSNNCADWDSLGQLIISAAIYDRFGIDLTPDQAFQIRSMDAIRQLVRSEITTLSTRQPEALPYELPDNPELLPLLDQGDITRALAERYHGENDADPARSIRIVIASSFTCQPLETSLRLWGRAFGIDVAIEFFGFNQVQQALLSPDSPFRENTRGLNAVLVRLEDMPISSQDKCSDYANQLLEAIMQYLQETNGTLVAGTIPPPVSPFLDIDRTCFDMVRAKWRKGLAAINGLEILDFAHIIEQVGLASAGRADFDVIDRVPYAAKVYQQLGVELARLVRKKCIPPAKVLALDCDGILWGGSVAEDGIDGIELGPDSKSRSFKLFQKYILQLKQRGIILVLASRNHEHDVWEVFDKHPEMVLKREDIAIARINWNAKSQNLCELAEHLNLSLDAFVFVDDDPVNRLEVETNIPQVTVVPMPKEPSRYCDALSRLWVFDAVLSTPEDQKRTQFIRQEDQRHVCERTSANLKSYLRDLELEVQLHFAGEHDLPRVAQLTQRTNAFNLSLRRRSLDQVKALGGSYTINVLNAKDRFGDYGLVGVSILRHDEVRNGIFELDTFLLSCRALARGIEEAFLYGIWNVVKSRGGQGLYAQYVVGPRNRPVIQFLLDSGFVEREESILETEIETVFELPAHIKWISL